MIVVRNLKHSGVNGMVPEETVDFYGIDRLLSKEEKFVRDKVRAFVEQECMPIIAEHFDKGTVPMQLVSQMAELGLLGVHVDGYGCSQSSHTVYGLICQELSRCDSGLRAMFSVQNSLVMFPIYRFGSDKQRKKWLPEMARGNAIGCFGLSEPGFGSNPGGMETRAQKNKSGYVLNGRKMWITNGTIAKVAIIWAKCDQDIRGFLVETDSPGFRATPIQRKFSYRTSATALIELKDCAVDADRILPGANGLKSILPAMALPAVPSVLPWRAIRQPGPSPSSDRYSIKQLPDISWYRIAWSACWWKSPRPSSSITIWGDCWIATRPVRPKYRWQK
jgi:glutaryl-CoA dehydrogenase